VGNFRKVSIDRVAKMGTMEVAVGCVGWAAISVRICELIDCVILEEVVYRWLTLICQTMCLYRQGRVLRLSAIGELTPAPSLPATTPPSFKIWC